MDKEFANDCLKAHNEYRKKHGAEPLELSEEMCKHSQKWAETIAQKDAMSYSGHKDYGESLYWASNSEGVKIPGRQAVDKWYQQAKGYDYKKEPEVLKHGLFTQIIWKASKQLGVGVAKSKTNKWYVVVNYYPRGNYKTQYTQNVMPPH